MKKVYLYEELGGLYLGSYNAQESPLEPGVFITPEHSTEIDPLPPQQGSAICFVGGQWIYVTDNRGAWFKPNGDVVQLNLITEAPENNWTRVSPELPDLPTPPKTQFTSLEFLDKFTEEEQLLVVQATMASAQVKLWYDRLLAASFVDIADPRTEGGIDALIAAGLIESNRKSALLGVE